MRRYFCSMLAILPVLGLAQEKLRTDGLYVWDNKVYELHFPKGTENILQVINKQNKQLGLDAIRTDSVPSCYPKGRIPIYNKGAYFHMIGFFNATYGHGTVNTCRSSSLYRLITTHYQAMATGKMPIKRSQEHDLTHLQVDPLSNKIYFEIGTHRAIKETFEGYLQNGDLVVNVEQPFIRSYNKDYKRTMRMYGLRRYKFYPYGTLPPGMDHPMKWIYDDPEAPAPTTPSRRPAGLVAPKK